MRNILVLAYAISPTRGSEYSVAWNYVTRMSKYNKLTVLYGTSGEHIGDTVEVQKYADESKFQNVVFIPVLPNNITKRLNWLNEKGYFGYSFYLAYHSWQKQVYKVALDLMNTQNFDLCHFVGPIGYREPGYLWKLGLPYIWGPIGGVSSSNEILQKNLPFRSKLVFTLRNLINTFQLQHNKRLNEALQNTDLLLTATTENRNAFIHHFGKNSDYIPENSITTEIRLNREKFSFSVFKKYHFVIVGSLIPRKAVNILLEALNLVKHKNRLLVDIVGGGPMRNALEKYAKTHQINELIIWHGQLSRKKAISVFENAHIHVITSISEGNPTTIWEAMSYGVPTISFDHCGMHDTICDKCGIRIKIHSYKQCVQDLATEIDNLLENPSRFEQMALGTVTCAYKYTWELREKYILGCYDKAIKNHSHKH